MAVIMWMCRTRKILRRPEDKAVLSGILRFLGLAPSTLVCDFRAAEHHVVGNGMWLDTTSLIRFDERWRQALTEDDLRAFQAVAENLNQAYGYAAADNEAGANAKEVGQR